MKKLIIALLLMVVMVGCESTPQAPYDDTELRNKITELETQLALLENYDDTELRAELENLYTQSEVDTLLQAIRDIQDLQYTNEDIDEGFEDIQLILDSMQVDIDSLEEILINLGVIEGLNGQQEWYITEQTLTPMTMSATAIELGSELDKNHAPSYVLDEKGDYIPFDDVARKLMDKYYGTYTLNSAKLGFQVSINVDVYVEENINGTIVKTPIQKEEFITRTILLIEELSHYDFYIISSSQLYIQTNSYGATSWITVPIATLRSSFITLNAEVMIAGLYEVDYGQLTFNGAIVQQYYDDYVTAKTFSDYVLDYK